MKLNNKVSKVSKSAKSSAKVDTTKGRTEKLAKSVKGAKVTPKAEKVEAVKPMKQSGWNIKQIMGLMMGGVNPVSWFGSEILDGACSEALLKGSEWRSAFKASKAKIGYLVIEGRQYAVLSGKRDGDIMEVEESIKLGKGLFQPSKGVTSFTLAQKLYGKGKVHWVASLAEVKKLVGQAKVFGHVGGQYFKKGEESEE